MNCLEHSICISLTMTGAGQSSDWLTSRHHHTLTPLKLASAFDQSHSCWIDTLKKGPTKNIPVCSTHKKNTTSQKENLYQVSFGFIFHELLSNSSSPKNNHLRFICIIAFLVKTESFMMPKNLYILIQVILFEIDCSIF